MIIQPLGNDFPTTTQIQAVRTYIKQSWKSLSRSLTDIVEAAKDPKVYHLDDRPWPVYIPPTEDYTAVRRSLRNALSPEKLEQIELRPLPGEVGLIEEHGLLYVPYEYVVPGGRFNEVYGWDSYFILLGLLQDGEIELAKSQCDQLLYEVKHYGTVLNANRTYFLTRSQPPFLTQMLLKVFAYTRDKNWLQEALPIAERYYYYWTIPPHQNQATGLSRYYDWYRGAAPEVIASERDEAGRTHYDRIREFYRTHSLDDYDINLYYDRRNDYLTDLFYKGDRSMRESGFDPTNRFGPFSVDIIHYAPVCLNVLLYQMEQDMVEINRILGFGKAGYYWGDRAYNRHKLIDKYLWDEKLGLYMDYNFATGRRRRYEFLSTFYPLWAGIATETQAERVVEHLWKFDAPGGLLTSLCVTGNQWDSPFGWAPLQLIAIQGLHRYGYHQEATRIARNFITLLVRDFERCGTLLEKYDVEKCTGEVSDEIHFGYSTNEEGFGWTNGVFLELLQLLGAEN